MVPSQMTDRFRIALLVVGVVFPFCSSVSAGQSASNWIVVVNGDSIASRTIANAYGRLRGIPPENFVVLDGVPEKDVITYESFRSDILEPVLTIIDERKLAAKIDGIAYSADFPTSVNVRTLKAKIDDLPYYFTPIASINSMTYFYQDALVGSPRLLLFSANTYACDDPKRLLTSPSADQTWEPWKVFENLRAGPDHIDAAEQAESMLEQFPSNYPLHYLAAVEFAKANESEKAIDALASAIKLGWSYRSKIQGETAFFNLKDNIGFQLTRDSCADEPFNYLNPRGFDARRSYAANMVAAENNDEGSKYLLSTVLAVTRSAGLSLGESIAQLERAAAADQTHPTGVVVLTETGDPRSKTRSPAFDLLTVRLQSLDQKTNVLKSSIPKNIQDVTGMILGRAKYTLADQNNQILPGAIVDNFTSYGGIMRDKNGQTNLAECLRAGAAGSSGTVTEPYTILPKIAHPMIHYNYMSGLTLAEAYYASSTGPYQLLIVGDPLCNPFGSPPAIISDGPTKYKTTTLPISLQLSRDPSIAVRSKPTTFEITFDGVLQGRIPAQTKLRLNLEDATPGAHDLNILVTDDSAIENKSEHPLTFWLDDPIFKDSAFALRLNKDSKATLEEPSEDSVISIDAIAPEALSNIRVVHQGEVVGTIDDTKATITIPIATLGYDQIRLHLVGDYDGKEVRSRPITFSISIPETIRNYRKAL
jgi:hypothetical protein